MQPGDIERASGILWDNWQASTRIEALPVDLVPGSREEAYRVQELVERHSAHPIAGWKIAATSEAGQAHINVSGPLAGRLLTERGHPSGAELVLGANIMRVAEPEFAFRLGRTLGPGDGPYEVDTVMGAVDALLPSIEVPDSRFVDFSAVGERQLIADDGCAHEYVVGAAGPDTWRDVDLAEHAVSISAGPGREHAGKGGNALGDPRVALTWLVNEVTALGGSVEAGQIVMTGACAVPLPVEPGDAVVADFGPLGTVTASFA